jgi:glycosyltransferase involved in cell wall biosynthesis
MHILNKLHLFGRSIYSRSAARKLDALLDGDEYYILHAHNLYPLISPSVLIKARQRRVPVVFHCHNYRLTCPVELHFRKNKTCRKCLDGGVVMCLLLNCRGNLVESMAYNLQNFFARMMGIYDGLVDWYIAPTNFTRDWLATAGIPAEKLVVLPYPVPVPKSVPADSVRGSYVAFAGRCSSEKGLDILLAAVRKTGLPLHVAGVIPEKAVPGKITWRGFLQGAELESFYHGARFLVVPSLWFETFGLVVGEAMSHGIPVIASRIGALAELVEDGRTGLLFSPGAADELAEMMLRLWNEPEFCHQLGTAGRKKILRLSHPDVYYAGLIRLYEKALGRMI